METEICLKYRNGLSSKQLSQEYNCSTFKILSILKKHNEQRRTGSEIRRQYPLKEDFFEVIDNEEKAYFLGFLYADGCVTEDKRHCKSLRFYLHPKDEEILIKFNQLMTQGTKPILTTNQGLKGVSFNSSKLFGDLNKLGVVPNKTFLIRLPNLKDNLLHHFIRGYFDGDGCVSFSSGNQRITFSTCQQFALDLHKHFKKIGISNYLFNSRKNCWYLCIAAKKDFWNCFNYLYKDATIFLQRKREKFITNQK